MIGRGFETPALATRPVKAERPVLKVQPVEADALEDVVVVYVDTAGARAIADAMEFTFGAHRSEHPTHPSWFVDVITLRNAAVSAELMPSAPVAYVPGETRAPLRIVAGGGA